MCDGPRDDKCASKCFNRFAAGTELSANTDQAYWESFIASRREAIRDALQHVDVFIAPSLYLRDRIVLDGGLPRQRVRHLGTQSALHVISRSSDTYAAYGFDKARLSGGRRVPGEPYTFGFTGRHVPAKGIDDLITAFRGVRGDARLRIWGRPDSQVDASLHALADGDQRISFEGEYHNADVVVDVLNRVDALVVPSRWVENAPLVIHEAQQNRTPVITANVGGMAELVR